MNTISDAFTKIVGEKRLFINEPMKGHTTIKIGGPADYYVDATSLKEIEELTAAAKNMSLPFFLFGGGTNMIVSEKGIRGLVIKNNCRRIDVMGMKGRVKNNVVSMDKTLVFAEAGAITNQLVRFTIEQGLSGLEYALGLPGTIGGAVAVNANYPKENISVGEQVKSAQIMTQDGEIKEVDRDYLRFGFDTSSVKRTRDVILSIIFDLKPMDKKLLWDRGTEAITYRNETQPKNIIGGVTFRNTQSTKPVHNSDKPISVNAMIEQAGLIGLQKNGISLSEVNPRYIINDGSGTTEDVLSLVKEIKDKLFQVYGAIVHFDVIIQGEL